ncbi:helix-turn-helix domain-containing protein [Plantactinospora sp. B5E13]|uniref:TetR/AcrR family transcriptional regulator n=1 Tax=unclassified Plantactinospora TaxID=2631981 RepID=UPI00325E0B50
MRNEDTKTRILTVAVELFTAHGYDQTSLREIADRVGLTKASLYYHYPSKQALLLALVQPLVDDWRRAVERLDTTAHNPENVRATLGEFLDIVLRHRQAAAIFLRDTPAVLASIETIWEEVSQLAARLHAWLAGPEPTTVDQIRAVAAAEVLGVALSSARAVPDVDQTVLHATLLEAAAAVLGLPPPDQGR